MVGLFRKWFGKEAFAGAGGYRELAHVAYPLVLMSASNVVMQFTDRKFLGNYSTGDMAAALPSGVLYHTLFCFFLVLVSFTGAIVAQYYGAGQRRECVRAVWSGFYCAMAAGVVILTVVPLVGYAVIHEFVEESLREGGWEYFCSLIPSGIFACVGAPFFSFFSGRGKTLPVAAINISLCLFNILFDWLFIFGNWGFPRWGIFGAGFATSLSACIGALAIVLLYLSVRQSEYPTRRERKLRFDYIVRLFKFGAPAGCQVVSDVGCFTLVIIVVGLLGPVPTAAMTIAFSINNLTFMPLVGVADATAIVCGQYIGRKRKKVASVVPYRSWRLILVFVFLTGLLYVLFPEQLASFFRPDDPTGEIDFDEVVAVARVVLIASAAWNFADTLKFTFGGGLRGAGDTRSLLVINTCCNWLLVVPGILILVKVFQVHLAWVWFYWACCTFSEGVLVWLRFRSGAWRRIRMVKAERNAMAGVPVEEFEVPR